MDTKFLPLLSQVNRHHARRELISKISFELQRWAPPLWTVTITVLVVSTWGIVEIYCQSNGSSTIPTIFG